MRRILSWLSRLSWKWKAVLIVAAVLFIIAVVAPATTYYLRARDVPDYSEIQSTANMTFLVSYDSGDDLKNESTYTMKVAEIDTVIDSVNCFHTVVVMDPYPKRKVNAMIVGSATVTLATDEAWRSADDLRMVHQKVMQIDLPIVNTAITEITFSKYEGYPGWPYKLGDSWSYEVNYDTDAPFQPKWRDIFRAEVVADDVVLELGGQNYTCFKVVHTLDYTSNKHSPGAGEGATTTEYWPKESFPIAPIKTESTVDFRGVEIWTAVDAEPLP